MEKIAHLNEVLAPMTPSPSSFPMGANAHSETTQAATGPGRPQDVGRRRRSARQRLLHLMLLALAQQSVTMVDVGAASSAVFKATTAAVGALLLPQAAQAQVRDDRIIMPSSLRISEPNTTIRYVNIRFSEKPKGPVRISVTASDELNFRYNERTYDPDKSWPTYHIGFGVSAARDNDQTGESTDVPVTFRFYGGGYDETREVIITIVDNDEVNLVVSPSSLRIKEGESASYGLSLTRRPTNDVTVDIEGMDNDVRVLRSSVTFTPGRWRNPQFVPVVTAQDSSRGDKTVTLTHRVTSGRLANGASNSPVVVTVVDDEPGVRLSKDRIEVKERKTDTYAVVLHTKPTGPVTVTPSSNDTRVATVSGALTFTTANWNKAQIVTVTGVQDRTFDVAVRHQVRGYGNVTTADQVRVKVGRIRLPDLEIPEDPLTVGEGESDTYTVKLKTQPTGEVTVTLSSDDTGAASVSPLELTFTTSNWKDAQTVTVTGVQDADAENEELPVSHIASGANYNSLRSRYVTVIVEDPDTAGVTVSQAALTVREGESNTYTVVLDTEPTGEVTVELSSDDEDKATVSPLELTFTTGDWNDAQTVTVSGDSDPDANDERVTVSHDASGADYDDVDVEDVTVTVEDPDTAGVTVSQAALTVGEGESNTYTVKLDTEPAGDVTVTPSSNDTGAATVSGALTFTTSNWETPQTVTVTGKKAVSTPVTVSHTATGADYDNVQENEIGKVTVTVEEPASGVPSPPEGLTPTAGNGEVILTWNPLPGASVKAWVISYGKVGRRWHNLPPIRGESRTTGTVPNLTNGVEYRFRVQAKNNHGWSEWSDTKNATPEAINLVLSAENLEVREDDTRNYTVKLNIQPRGSVTVRMKSKDKSIATVSPETLIFNRVNWNTPKTVTVTGVRDYVDTKQNKPVDVGHTVTDYDNNETEADSVTVEVINDDVEKVRLSTRELTVTEGSTDTYTYTVKLDTIPSGSVRVRLAPRYEPEGQQVKVWPAILTFDSSSWNRPQTATVQVDDDDVDRGKKTVTVDHFPLDTYANRLEDDLTVTVIDNDSVPAQPEGLAAEPGNGKVTLSWNDPDDSSITVWQVIYQKSTGGVSSGWKDITGSTATTTTHTVTGLENGAEYSFHIRAKNDAGTGEQSVMAKATPAATTTTPERIVVPSTVRVVEGASGETEGYVDVRFRERPTDTVTVTVRATPPSDRLTVGESPKTLTPDRWDLGIKDVQIPIGASDNDRTDDNLPVQLTITVSGGGYGTVLEPITETVTVEIIDDEANHVVVSHGDLKLQEDESASYAVSLSKRPTANVTVNIGGTTGNVGLTVTPSTTLTFTTGNWDVRQTVTVTADDDIETSSVVKLTHVANASSGSYSGVSGGTVTVELDDGGGDSLSGSALTLAEETDHQDAARAAKARAAELAGTSRALLGMASDMLGVRLTGAAAMGGGGGDSASLGDQAWDILENLLGSNGEFSTDLDLEQIGERLWSQSFQITAAGGGAAQADGISSGGKGSWTLWGAGDLRSYRGDAEEHISFNGNLKTGWLGLDYGFNDQWLAGLAVSYSSGESDYSYRKTSGATDGGKLSNEVISFYPYGSVQLSERFRLWGLAGFGFGSQHHQHNEGGDKAEGKLRLQMGVIGFTQQLNDVGALQISLAGDVALARSTTDWPAASGLQDVEVSLSRARLGVDTRFPLTEQATGYVNVKGRLDGGELEMGAAEVLAGLHFDGGRFSGSLQGQQVYAFDGSYTESGLSAQLSFRTHPDGSGLAWELQPSYGYGAGEFALAGEQVSLWSDEQLEALTGHSSRDGEMEVSSRVGYGIHLQNGELLLTPFTELRLGEGGSRSLGLGLALETPSWDLELSASTETNGSASPTNKLQLTFSKKL